MMVCLATSISAETIVVNDVKDANPINVSNQTKVFNLTESEFEQLVELGITIKETNAKNLQIAEFIAAIADRDQKQKEIQSKALENASSTIAKQAATIENLTVSFQDLQREYLVEIRGINKNVQVLEQNIFEMRIWNTIKNWLYFFVGITLSVIFIRLKRTKKLYFILRWLRNRIPIRV